MDSPSDKPAPASAGSHFRDFGPTAHLQTLGSYYDKCTGRHRPLRRPADASSAEPATPPDAWLGSGRHRIHDARSLTDVATLEAVLDNVKDAIITLDGNARVHTCNLAGLRLFGYSADEMDGLSIEALLPYKTSPRAFLDRLSQRADDTVVDLASHEVEARRRDGSHFTAEIAASKLTISGHTLYALCMRDITERRSNEQALRDSEGRYRALVENCAEAILVLDVDRGRFVDANDNATRFFGMARERLLAIGPEAISPAQQGDGQPSFGIERGHVRRALAGESPVFEWTHIDAAGLEVPCEVRFTRLPSSRRRLIRASILNISARKRVEVLAHGERQVLELIAANAPQERTLGTICRVLERLYPELHAVVSELDGERGVLRQVAAPSLAGTLRDVLAEVPVGASAGSGAAAASLRRQVSCPEIATDPAWREYSAVAAESRIAAACATPIITAGDRLRGTLEVYLARPGAPDTEALDTFARLARLAGIAIDRRLDESALRSSESRWRELFENVLDGVYQSLADGTIVSANPALVRMLGHESEAELRSVRNARDFYVNPADRDALLRALEHTDVARNHEYRLRRADGTEVVVIENARALRDAEGRVRHYEGTITDITERKQAEMAIFEEKERLRVTLQSIGDGVITTDAEGVVDYMNPMAEQLTGWERRAAVGRPIAEIVQVRREDSRQSIDNPVFHCLREGRVTSLPEQTVMLTRDGEAMSVQDSAAPIRDRSGHVIGAVMIFHDVSKERGLRRQLSYQASHDRLTGLINRAEFENRLSMALEEVHHDPERRHALLYLDLDQFKVINDTSGHVAGDHLLKQVTGVLLARIRATDLLARIGGDEFAILLCDCEGGRALQVADDLREALAEHRFVWKARSLTVSASIGVVNITAEGEDAASLFSLADVACYAAKDEGRNRVHLCQVGDVPQKHKEMQWVSRITDAMEENRLELYFQPIVAIGDNDDEDGHYELLLRMRDRKGKLVPPSEFIPAAERYNLMPQLDRWVVRETLSRLVCLEGGRRYSLAINLSGTSLNEPRFLDFIVEEFERVRPPQGAICFEITETAAISNLDRVARFMNELKRRGARFSLDDFGSGLSSFTYLKNLPVDYLKIDGHFIQNVVDDPIDQSMVDAINKVGVAMGIKTIAERVENGEVLERLAALGVAYAQGYHIAVPRPVAELAEHEEALRHQYAV